MPDQVKSKSLEVRASRSGRVTPDPYMLYPSSSDNNARDLDDAVMLMVQKKYTGDYPFSIVPGSQVYTSRLHR